MEWYQWLGVAFLFALYSVTLWAFGSDKGYIDGMRAGERGMLKELELKAQERECKSHHLKLES